MTFKPEQIIDTEEWLKLHDGHKIIEEIDEYPLCDGKAVKRMHHHKCVTCGHRHLYKMETVENNG